MADVVKSISYAMSLRTPQEEALSYLDAISSHCDYKNDDKTAVEAVDSENCENQTTVNSKFEFPYHQLNYLIVKLKIPKMYNLKAYSRYL